MYTVFTGLKPARSIIPTIHSIDFATISVDDSKRSESNLLKCGVLVRDANGIHRICQISQYSCVNVLQTEANANFEGLKISEQNQYNVVFLYIDSYFR